MCICRRMACLSSRTVREIKTTKWCGNAGQRERAAGLGDGTLERMSGIATKKEQLWVTAGKKSAQSMSFCQISVLVVASRPQPR